MQASMTTSQDEARIHLGELRNIMAQLKNTFMDAIEEVCVLLLQHQTTTIKIIRGVSEGHGHFEYNNKFLR